MKFLLQLYTGQSWVTCRMDLTVGDGLKRPLLWLSSLRSGGTLRPEGILDFRLMQDLPLNSSSFVASV